MYKIGVVLIVLLVLSGLDARQGFGDGEQDWGFVTVREGAHMFYWLYHTTADVTASTDRPLTIWLQGGPGASSTGYGNFEELGPLTLELEERDFTWVKEMNVLFIDNPVGSGFSYVDDVQYLTTDITEIGLDLVELMKQFYVLHPEFKTVPLHIFSESYGGKMAAEFAYVLDKAIKAGEIDCDLQSAAFGDPWISPIDSMYSWAPFLLNMGIVDQKGHDEINAGTLLTQAAMDRGQYVEATNLWGYTEMIIDEVTLGVDFYNVLLKTRFSSDRIKSNPTRTIEDIMYRTLVKHDAKDLRDDMLDELMNGPVRAALGIPASVVWGGQSSATFRAQFGDFMKPVIDVVELLLNNTSLNVIVFTGQLDLICATPGTVVWVDKLKWSGKNGYVAAPREGIGGNGILEGYYKTYGKFSMYWANRAGHMVPAENPTVMNYILRRATNFG